MMGPLGLLNNQFNTSKSANTLADLLNILNNSWSLKFWNSITGVIVLIFFSQNKK